MRPRQLLKIMQGLSAAKKRHVAKPRPKRNPSIPSSLRSTMPKLAALLDQLDSDDQTLVERAKVELKARGDILQPLFVSQAVDPAHSVAYRVRMLDLVEWIDLPLAPDHFMKLIFAQERTTSTILKERYAKLQAKHVLRQINRPIE